jgi:hypothetical protein
MESAPHLHGWIAQGRLTAYANEDFFIRNNGIGYLFDTRVDQGDKKFAEILGKLKKSGFESFAALTQWSYNEMVLETKKGKIKPIDSTATNVLRRLLAWGAEITVVSNSGTERIVDLLTNAGLDAYDADEDPKAQLRVRGHAKKFELGKKKEGFKIKDYWLDVNRPNYLKILNAEKPDAVIGDVFSLDLALPLHLAREESKKFGGIKLVLRTRPYTPQWTMDFFSNAKTEKKASLLLMNEWNKLPSLLGIS